MHNKFRISGDINVGTVTLLFEKYLYVQENNFRSCSLRIREELFLGRVLQLVLPLATKNTYNLYVSLPISEQSLLGH
jgi:hypothetical protein